MVKQIISYLNHNIALYQCHEQGNETPEEGTGDEMETTTDTFDDERSPNKKQGR